MIYEAAVKKGDKLLGDTFKDSEGDDPEFRAEVYLTKLEAANFTVKAEETGPEVQIYNFSIAHYSDISDLILYQGRHCLFSVFSFRYTRLSDLVLVSPIHFLQK